MKNSFAFILFAILAFANAKASDTLKLSRTECESLFLQNNGLILAEKLGISQAEAKLVQARLLPNPEISIEDINLWTTSSGTNNPNYFGDELPPIFGKFGKNMQLSFNLEQLIETAGKRKLRIAIGEQEIQQAEAQYEEILRELLVDFRNNLTDWQYLRRQIEFHQFHYNSLLNIIQLMETRAQEGIITKEDPIRLKISALELKKEIHALETDLREAGKELKINMHIPTNQQILIEDIQYGRNHLPVKIPDIDFLIEIAKEHRPDLKQARTTEQIMHTTYLFEKAQQAPDLNIKAHYERGGFFHNFIGIGIGLDLPLFDRNQGNIKQAKIAHTQAELLSNYLESAIDKEISYAREQLIQSIRILSDPESDFDTEIDELYRRYTEQFKQRNISLLQYTDFTAAWLDHKIIGLESAMEVHKNIDYLNFLIGEDLIK